MIKKIIDYLLETEGITEEKLNDWVTEYGYNYSVKFQNGKMTVHKKD